MDKVRISYNEKEEMMLITVKNKPVVFYGNYWDFSREPKGLYNFLIQLGLAVEIKKDLKSIG